MARFKPIRIHFEDRGQEWLWWDLDPPATPTGMWKVVAANAMAWLFVPSYVSRGSIGRGKRPVLFYGIARAYEPVAIPVVRIEARLTDKQAAQRASTAVRRERRAARQQAMEVA